MKIYEVILDKPTVIEQYCPYTDDVWKIGVDHTTALICAFSEARLKEKLEKLYQGVRVIRFKELVIY